MLSHTQAKDIVDAIPGVSPVESLFARCVALHETGYGSGWKPPGPPDGGQGSWNMGAITTLHPDQYSFRHVDSKFDDDLGRVTQYTTWFAGDPTPEKGFERLCNTVLKQNVRDALRNNDFMQATAAMHENQYFLGIHSRANPITDRLNIEDYYNALIRCLHTIGAETGETQPEVLT